MGLDDDGINLLNNLIKYMDEQKYETVKFLLNTWLENNSTHILWAKEKYKYYVKDFLDDLSYAEYEIVNNFLEKWLRVIYSK